MTYILADTQNKGKYWASKMLFEYERYKVLSSEAQIRGKAFTSTDCVYITTSNPKLMNVLLPTFCGCSIFYNI
jgi:hypothetical protein